MTGQLQRYLVKILAASRRLASLRQKLTNLLPPMWYSDNLDSQHIIRERIWFLRENRFLFFTRNGPVEITVKPTVVLASAIVGMVGVSVIFLSTILASYSAIEVMRDETIQTAEASIKSTESEAQRFGTPAPHDMDDDKLVIWHDDITLRNDVVDPNAGIAGKTATLPEALPSRFTIQPKVHAPSPAEFSNGTLTNQLPTAHQKIKRNNRQGIYISSKLPDGSLVANEEETVTTHTETINSNLANDPSVVDLGLVVTPAHQALNNDIVSERAPEKSLNNTAEDVIPGASPHLLPDANNAEDGSSASDDDDSFASTAAGFAIAMLPRLFAENGPSASAKKEKAQPPATSSNESATGPLDDGFYITAYNAKNSPLLPSMSEAARAKKMLMSLDGEIIYIRKSISQLGIKTNYLPHYDTAEANAQDTDFKQLMITLAEHRAALRKIPFKTPMLYFYISSEYGYRKHPKTGKKTFHHGIDLAGTWQENVRSTAPGTVVFAGHEGAFGKVVRIEHDFGISTLYAHLSRITVSVGDYVAENTVIGKMGNTGRSAGAHLHYEIQVNGKSVDPADFFTIGRQMSISGELRQTSLID